jgi:hypothetical protein
MFAPLAEISLPEVATREEVLASVSQHVMPRLPALAGLISVDGLDGTGKTEIGGAIATLSDGRLIHIDDFLNEQQGQFLDALRINELRHAVDADEPRVIEGCLVGVVLQKLGREADFKIYVARTGQMITDPQHEWCDEHELLFGTGAASDLIEKEEHYLRRFCESGLFGMDSDNAELPALRKELITYHRSFEPHLKADLIVKIVRLR